MESTNSGPAMKKKTNSGPAIEIREVWLFNLEFEIALIHHYLSYYPVVSFDTEFPGTILHLDIPKTSYSNLSASRTYDLMRSNLHCIHIIQLGLALSDPRGISAPFAWEFNFSDFDIDTSLQNPDSIELLKRQGIDFKKNRAFGIPSADFAARILRSGLFCNGSFVSWVTFHGAYDFGFLVKMLTQSELPLELNKFLQMVRYFFGRRVFDLKTLVKSCDGLYGGLDKVAKSMEVERVAGKSHQAGSDSLLTLQTFFKVKQSYFSATVEKQLKLEMQSNVIYGLEVEKKEIDRSNGHKMVQLWYRRHNGAMVLSHVGAYV